MSTKEEKEGSKKSRETILDYVIVRAENVGTAETLIQRKRREENRLEVGREFLENFEKTRKIIRPFTRKKTTSVETKSSVEIKKSLERDKKNDREKKYKCNKKK